MSGHSFKFQTRLIRGENPELERAGREGGWWRVTGSGLDLPVDVRLGLSPDDRVVCTGVAIILEVDNPEAPKAGPHAARLEAMEQRRPPLYRAACSCEWLGEWREDRAGATREMAVHTAGRVRRSARPRTQKHTAKGAAKGAATVTASALRIPLAEIVSELVRDRKIGRSGSLAHMFGIVDQAPRTTVLRARAGAKGKGDEHYREVVSRYRRALKDHPSAPTKALIAQYPNWAEATVRYWLRVARQRGFLGQAKRGRPGEARKGR